MPRSSGFDLSWMPGVSDATKVFLSIVMFIGGGSTSTAGGIRVTTFAVILLTCRAAFTGRHDINAFHRRIHTQGGYDRRGRKYGMPHAGHRGVDGADDHHRLLAVRRTVRYLLRVRPRRATRWAWPVKAVPRCYTFSPPPCSSGVSDRSPSPTRFRVHTISRPSATPPSRSWSADDTASYTCSCLQSHMNIVF